MPNTRMRIARRRHRRRSHTPGRCRRRSARWCRAALAAGALSAEHPGRGHCRGLRVGAAHRAAVDVDAAAGAAVGRNHAGEVDGLRLDEDAAAGATAVRGPGVAAVRAATAAAAAGDDHAGVANGDHPEQGDLDRASSHAHAAITSGAARGTGLERPGENRCR